jgi:hypothetical protein
MLFSLFRGKSTTTRKGTNVMDMFLQNIDPVAVKK